MENCGTHSKPILLDDVYVAAGLILLSGEEPSLSVDCRGRVTFAFPSTSDTMSSFSEFTGGAIGPLAEYSRILKRLRGQMMSRRTGGQG